MRLALEMNAGMQGLQALDFMGHILEDMLSREDQQRHDANPRTPGLDEFSHGGFQHGFLVQKSMTESPFG